MAFQGFPKQTTGFLTALSKNNRKDWFDAHRDDYDRYWLKPAQELVTELAGPLQKVVKDIHCEPRVNGSIMRINRDVRFSKDKSPYKTNVDLWFWTGASRGMESAGLFFRLTPEELYVGAGMHAFAKEHLERYRAAVDDEKKGAALEAAVQAAKKARLVVGKEGYKKVPRGFDPDHPRAALLRHDGLYAAAEGPIPKEARSSKLVGWCVDRYEAAMPVFEWLRKHVAP
jgi:uncharacterized protein (TIGR02453 family)